MLQTNAMVVLTAVTQLTAATVQMMSTKTVQLAPTARPSWPIVPNVMGYRALPAAITQAISLHARAVQISTTMAQAVSTARRSACTAQLVVRQELVIPARTPTST